MHPALPRDDATVSAGVKHFVYSSVGGAERNSGCWVTVGKYNEAGVERQAWIWPGDVSNFKPSSKRMKYSERYFADEDAALAWLMLPN